MKIPFYQSGWFDIDLSALAKTLDHPLSAIAGPRIYNAIYRALLSRPHFSVNADWLRKKQTLSAWISDFLKSQNLQKGSILSIGCGLGIIEQPLIKAGFTIDLQECQTESLEYLKQRHPEEYQRSRIIIGSDLQTIPQGTYDAAMAITSTYALNNADFEEFFRQVSKILKKEGILVVYETALTFKDIQQEWKRRLFNRQHEGLNWGWKRSKNEFLKVAKQYGLAIQQYHLFNNDSQIIPRNSRLLPFRANADWQMLIFKREAYSV